MENGGSLPANWKSNILYLCSPLLWHPLLVAEQLNTRPCVVCLSVLRFCYDFCLNDQAHIAWFTSGVARGQLRGSQEEEDYLWWKTTFDGIQPSMEDDLRWRTPSMEDGLRWKTDERRPSIEDNLRWKTTFDGKRPSMEDDLRWKATFLGILWHIHSGVGRGDYGT